MFNKKQTVSIVVALSLLVLGGRTALADVTEPVANSKGKVSFIKDDDQTPIDPNKPEVIDPSNPGEPGEVSPVEPGKPEGPDNPSQGGGGNGSRAFNINWVSNFKFGEIKIGGNMTSYALPTTLYYVDDTGALTNTVSNVANFIQVTDNQGTNEGWNLMASATPFKEDGGTSELAGATMTLKNPSLLANPDGAGLEPDITENDINLLETTDQNLIMSAAASKGQGTWTLGWGAKDDGKLTYQENDGVELKVPMTAQPKADKSYTSEITWVLTAGPTA